MGTDVPVGGRGGVWRVAAASRAQVARSVSPFGGSIAAALSIRDCLDFVPSGRCTRISGRLGRAFVSARREFELRPRRREDKRIMSPLDGQ